MDDVSNGNRFSAGPLAGDYIGQTSGAICKNIINNTIVYPDLMRDTGKVIYLENISPFSVNSTSRENIKVVIKF